MFNKDRFHNQLALNLGYQRLLNDNRYNIKIEESKNGGISVCVIGFGKQILFEEPVTDYESSIQNTNPEIKEMIRAVHQAYIEAQRPF